jgi:C4-dicarboxylate transporter, DcuC family
MLLASLVIIVVAVYSITRGIDVRLALLSASFALAGMTGDVTPIVRKFLETFSNEKFVIPICTAMGFAYVLKQTQCDQHLVRLLTKPLRHGKFFLIPGVVLVGFTVNIPIISQTSTAVCIGAVVVPLMQAAKISPVIIGASLLLGSSLGGELLNPGAPELNTVSSALDGKYEMPDGEKLRVKPQDLVRNLYPIVFPQLLIAGAIFWFMSYRYEKRRPPTDEPTSEVEIGRVNLLRAFVPIVPLILLFLTGPPLNWIEIPKHWVVDAKSESAYGTRLIGLAMFVGVIVALIVTPRSINQIPGAFFDGAGYAFAHIVSLIVTANCFGEAIDRVGLAKLVGEWISASANLLHPISALLPMGFGTVSGSGMAATQSLFELYIEPCRNLNVDPREVGGMVSLGAAAGRTMSPVAAVALMSARLTGTNSFQLAARVAPPLIAGLVVVVILRMCGVV